MGIIFLHSAHHSKPFKMLMGTTCNLHWREGGEVFRSGCCYRREHGRIFYFQPGHESFPTFYNENVQKIIKNAVRWTKPVYRAEELTCPQVTAPNKKN